MILTPFSDMSPVPRVAMRLDGLDAEAELVTVSEVTPYGERIVRGGYRIPAASVLVLDDFLVPLNRPVTYRVHLLGAGGVPIRTEDHTAPPVVFHGTVVQHIIDPYRSARVRYLAGSENGLEWQHDGDLVRPGNARLPVWIGAGRWPLQGVPLGFGTETADQEAAMRRVLGLAPGDQDVLPVVAMRTSHPTRLEQPFIAAVRSPRVVGLDWLAGGWLTHWRVTADEVRPPGAALVRPSLTWADVAAVYSTWTAVASTYSTWTDLMVDASTIGGAADA